MTTQEKTACSQKSGSSGLYIGQFADGYTPVVDGVVTVIRNYAYWLNKKYGQCDIFAPNSPGHDFDEPFAVHGFFSIPVPKRPPYRAGFPTLDSSYHKALKGKNFDLLHCHSPFPVGNEALRLGRKLRIPVVATFHSKYYDDFKQFTGSDFLARQGTQIVSAFYRRADSVWTVNEATTETLREYGYKGPIVIMPNGTDMHPPAAPEETRALVEQLCGIDEKLPLLLFVGQLIWQKNLRLIAQGAAKAWEQGHRFRLCFVGEGNAREELSQLITQLGLEACIRLLGVVRDRNMLAGLYSRSSALLFPSLYDTAGLVVREAASLGCPTVVIRDSNASDNMIHGENGFLCDDTVDSMADTIADILRDQTQAKAIGQRAGETLALPWEQVVDRAHEQYLEVIRQYRATHK